MTETATPNRTEMMRLSNAQLKQRIQLNQAAKFGLETASTEQLNGIFFLCQRMDLDPLTDITLMHGHPWFTINGTFRMMRRHPEYAGFRQWPLGSEDKVTGGWSETDIVWATEIRTKSWGAIVQWGKVTKEEVDEALGQAGRSGKRAAPIAYNPVEIAQKRSAQHAIRAAFGQDAAPDEVEMETLIAEEIAARKDPVKQAQDTARYDEIIGNDEKWDQGADVPKQLPSPAAEPEDEGDEVSEEDARLAAAWARNRQLSQVANSLKLRPPTLPNRAPVEQIEAANDALDAQLRDAQVPT